MAGGDGSLAVVAAAARAHGLPFVCVPAGTRTTSRSTGVDRHDLVGALDAFGDHGVERSIDVAEVNGRVFLNNVSLGIYGEAVQQTGYRDAKVRTLLETTAEVLGRVGPLPRCASSTTSAASIGTRPWCSCRTTPTRSIARRARDAPAARRRRARHRRARPTAPQGGSAGPGLERDAARGGRDSTRACRRRRRGGRELDAPLAFVIQPGALRVRISSRHPGVSPSGRLP